MGKAKKGLQDDESKFEGQGVDFKCKLIGFVNVPSARGDDICQEALTKLKQLALRLNKEKKEHKQKITVNITLKGIRLIDEQSEKIEHAHPIKRISYISHDNNDKRTFGYIVGTKEGYKLFAIRTMKEAEQITRTLKELFQVVYERHKAQKAAEQGTTEVNGKEEKVKEETEEQIEVGEEQNEELSETALVDFGQLNEQIEAMQSDDMKRSDSTDMFTDLKFTTSPDPFACVSTTTINNKIDSFNPFDMMNDSTTGSDSAQTSSSDPFAQYEGSANQLDLFAQVPPNTPATKATFSDDLFSLNTPAPPEKNVSNNNDTSDAPLLINDPFAELKKNISELHKQNQFQQQQQFGYQQGFGNQPHAFPNQQQQPTNLQFQGQQNNPFAQGTSPSNPAMHSGPTSYQSNMQPPTLPPRVPPVQINPFQAQPPQPTEQDDGWTFTKKPTPAPRQPVKSSQPTDDPFGFLDDQTGKKVTPAPIAAPPTQPTNSANNDLLDFLG